MIEDILLLILGAALIAPIPILIVRGLLTGRNAK